MKPFRKSVLEDFGIEVYLAKILKHRPEVTCSRGGACKFEFEKGDEKIIDKDNYIKIVNKEGKLLTVSF